jgi:hypothetical protein
MPEFETGALSRNYAESTFCIFTVLREDDAAALPVFKLCLRRVPNHPHRALNDSIVHLCVSAHRPTACEVLDRSRCSAHSIKSRRR